MPSWYEVAVDWIPVLMTGMVGIYVAYIAKRQKDISEEQKNINAQKLRLELLEKRLPLYQEVVELIDSVFASGRMTDEQDRMLRDWDTSHAFLFGVEVQEWIEKISSEAHKRHGLHVSLKSEDTPEEYVDEVRKKFWESTEWIQKNREPALEAFQKDMKIDFR